MPANDKSTQDYFGHAIILSDTFIIFYIYICIYMYAYILWKSLPPCWTSGFLWMMINPIHEIKMVKLVTTDLLNMARWTSTVCDIQPWNLRYTLPETNSSPWKLMLGRWISFLEGRFAEAMLVLGRVIPQMMAIAWKGNASLPSENPAENPTIWPCPF